MKYLLAAAMIAISTPAMAIDCTIVEGYLPECTRNDFNPGVLPPSYWDHPFLGEVIEYQVSSQEEMAKVCPDFGEMSPRMLGCSRKRIGRCYIFIADEKWLKFNRVSIGAVRRHEIAHCNGWPGTHPSQNPPMLSNDKLKEMQDQIGQPIPPPMTIFPK